MTTFHFPDPGAYITVCTKSGGKQSGYVAEPHVFVNDDWLCLVSDPPPENETKYTYIRCSEVEAWVWDCTP